MSLFSSRTLLPLAVLVVAVLLVAACGPSDPATRIAEDRRHYSIQHVTWLPQEPAALPQVAVEDAEGEDAEGAEDDVLPAEAEVPDALESDAVVVADDPADPGTEIEARGTGPGPTTILFDVTISKDGRDQLPGLTLDITHADADESEKETRRHFVDLEGMTRGELRQVAFELDGWDYDEGDVFAVELRENVPAGERGEYQEWN